MSKTEKTETTELETMKKLMILDLVIKGVSQGDIADIVGVSAATVSEMFPKGVLKKYRKLGKNSE